MGLFDNLIDKAKSISDQALNEVERLTTNSSQKASEIWQSTAQTVSETCGSIVDTAMDVWNNKIPSKEEITVWAEDSYNYIKSLSTDFDTDKMWEKISAAAAKAGQDLIVMVLTIYYTISESIQKNNGQK